MIQLALVIPIGLAALCTTGFVANEWTQGGMSEMMGFGHHHMLGGCMHHIRAMHTNGTNGTMMGNATMRNCADMHARMMGGGPNG